MDSKKEILLHEAHKKYFQLILGDLPVEQIQEIIADDISGYGTTVDEKINEIDKLRKMVVDQRAQGESIEMNFIIEPVNLRMSPEKDMAIFNDEAKVIMNIEGEENIIKIRLSTVYEFICDNWKVVHLHGSTAVESEDDSWHLNEWKQKNKELQKLVEEKTIELKTINQELELETSLERVRAVANGMMKPDNLLAVCEVLFAELRKLGFQQLRNSMINIHHDDEGYFLNNDFSEELGRTVTRIAYNSHPVVEHFLDQIKKTKDAFAEISLKGDKLDDWKKLRKSLGEIDDHRLENTKGLYYYFYSIGTGAIGISTFNSIDEDKLNILKRFRNVFDFAYRRYMDVSIAEAQARESRIELALERVRARTMAMQNSEELNDVAHVLFEQLRNLGGKLWGTGVALCKENSDTDEFWFANEKGILPPVNIPHTEDPVHNKLYEEWLNKSEIHSESRGGNDLKEHYDYMRSLTEVKPFFQVILDKGLSFPKWQQWNAAYFSQGYLMIITIEPYPEPQTLVRFAKVFQQAYTRFFDLQKAEAQAREAQIEAALERLRSRSMAMHKSNELADLSFELVKQVQALGVPTWFCAFNIYDDDEKGSLEWGSNVQGTYEAYRTPREGIFLRYFEAGQKGETLLINEIGERECAAHYKYLCSLPGVGEQLLNMKDAGIPFPTSQIDHAAYFKFGYILFITFEPAPEAHDIFKRFAKVFEQTYTRFLDLQKAEAQAREAQIEATLERIRAKSLAMHKTDDLGDVVSVLFEQMQELSVDMGFASVSIFIFEEGSRDIYQWIQLPDGVASLHVPYFEHPILSDLFDAKTDGAEYFSKIYTVEEKNSWVEKGLELTDYKNLPEEFKTSLLEAPGYAISITLAKNSGICIPSFVGSLPSAEDVEIMKRVGKVFEQTYTRFLDLKNAEAQAREAQIEASLERVRGRTLAMHNSEELAETAAVVFKQLIDLGISPNRLYIGIVKDDSGDIEFWATDEDGTKISTKFTGNKNLNESVNKMYNNWAQQQKSLTIDMRGKELEDYLNYIGGELHVPFKQRHKHKRRIQTIAFFSKGFIGIASPDEQPEETTRLLERFASGFNLTFTRFNDLKIAEANALKARQDLIEIKEARKKAENALVELQATQKQLIQSEKMASLGELTAGIAHEIQNPLNFVNNFSEVSEELVVELKEELDNGDVEEAKIISDDVIQNLKKISHHGHRASSIVKGMLEHSRTGDGKKELTDLNALADEYLRLAYHGLRAKDKSFNAEIKTDFDGSLPKINVVPQDIGRVLLNLFNNAFYACTERWQVSTAELSRSAVHEKTLTGFQTLSGLGNQGVVVQTRHALAPSNQPSPPTLTLTTKSLGNKIEIRVKDNGNGIPDKIKDKIFQPFFTTKPTGLGTGLGLSLSYDIIHAHGGDLQVKTKEGQETIFIVTLPA